MSEAIERGTAHRLKNHLAIMIGFCELLRRSMAETDPRVYDIQQIEAAGWAALDVIRDSNEDNDHGFGL